MRAETLLINSCGIKSLCECNLIIIKVTQPSQTIPLGRIVGGAFRAQAYMIEASSSQVPCTLPQSLETNNENKYHSVSMKNRIPKMFAKHYKPCSAHNIMLCSFWIEMRPTQLSSISIVCCSENSFVFTVILKIFYLGVLIWVCGKFAGQVQLKFCCSAPPEVGYYQKLLVETGVLHPNKIM